MGLLLDTRALVALDRTSRAWEEALAALGGEAITVPAIVYAKLRAGAELVRHPRTRVRLEVEILAASRPLSFPSFLATRDLRANIRDMAANARGVRPATLDRTLRQAAR